MSWLLINRQMCMWLRWIKPIPSAGFDQGSNLPFSTCFIVFARNFFLQSARMDTRCVCGSWRISSQIFLVIFCMQRIPWRPGPGAAQEPWPGPGPASSAALQPVDPKCIPYHISSNTAWKVQVASRKTSRKLVRLACRRTGGVSRWTLPRF